MMDWRTGRFHWYITLKRDSASRVGARFYGLVAFRTPLLAWFVDDAWYESDTSYGIAVGPAEAGVFLSSPDGAGEAP